MPDEAEAEHVVALALQPIRAAVDVPHAGRFELLASLDLRFDADEATIRERAQMPHDFDRLLEIAELDRRHVREVVVALRRVVVQPLNDVVRASHVDVDRGLAPHDVDAFDGGAERLSERAGGGIHVAAAMRDVLARGR